MKAETLLAYTRHIYAAEAAIEGRMREKEQFLSGCAEPLAQLRKGATIVEVCSGERPIQVPDGLIHDWIGVICIPGTTVEKTLALLQNIITRISTCGHVNSDLADIVRVEHFPSILVFRPCPTAVLSALFAAARSLFQTRAALQLEILALRHQLGVLQRSVKKPKLNRFDRMLWSWFCGPPGARHSTS